MRDFPAAQALIADAPLWGAEFELHSSRRNREDIMPKLIRLYITQAAIGFALAGVFVAMLLWFNIANLWHLVTHSDMGFIAVLVLWISNGVVFGGVQFAISVMRMKDDDDDEPRGGPRRPIRVDTTQMIPVRVAAKAGRNKRG
jgi:hypothetical protein